MEKKMRAVGIKMNIMMGVTMSLILSLVGTLTGGHFTIPSWLVSFGISLVISLVIGFAVPIKKVGDSLCKKCKANPQSMKGNLISALASDLIYTPIITIIMVSVMLTNAAKHLPPNAPADAVPSIGKALPGSLLICLVVGYIVIVVIQPIFLKMFMKSANKKD